MTRAAEGARSDPTPRELRRKFSRIASAGILFQGGAATVDTTTIVAAFVHGLTGSSFAVGSAAAIFRYGWLFPQIFVAHLAQRRARRMPFYRFGAIGRAMCLACLAALLWLGTALPNPLIVVLFFSVWTGYAFISGIVAVPYNDIVARSVPSSRRSRLLALRFFGGGILALVVAALATRILDSLSFPAGYALIFLLGSLLLTGSTISFLSAGESPAPLPEERMGFGRFLLQGFQIVRMDTRFRLFLYSRWLSGAVTLALPFYILEAKNAEIAEKDIAFFLVTQTVGSLVSNPVWGMWGDRRGKASLLVLVALLGSLAPILALLWIGLGWAGREMALSWFGTIFFLIGAVGNGDTIAQLGYLMEISPDDRRPAYSGYFNALAAPAALLPMVGALLADLFSFGVVFATSLAAVFFQIYALKRLYEVTKHG